MTIREELEEEESRFLSKYATLSRDSVGRERLEAEDDLRPCFQRDRDRILHCKAFRRLKHKTQVFLAPEGDHYRTRLTHTLEVSQIARTIAKCLHLNETLTEAIALGHDLGHTPFGHAGERVLNGLCPGGFKHSAQSVRTVEFLEKRGKGLNLTLEVRDGIRNHGTHSTPRTYEGAVVRLADKIAYINHDIDDSIRAGIFREEDIPAEFTDALGHSVRDRLNCMIRDVIHTSLAADSVNMSAERFQIMMQLRAWLFQHVYRGSAPKAEEGKAEAMIARLYEYFLNYPEQMPEEYRYFMSELDQPIERTVCDYIAGMSDQYAVRIFESFCTACLDRVISSCIEKAGLNLYYSKEVIEEVRARNDIVDLVSEHLALKRRGKTYVGLCPFHSEKTPSFSVSPDRQTYHCFGCGKGGNVIGFVMDYENLSFPEALRSLAARAGMQLPEREASKEELRERSLKERLLEIHKVAATHFYQLLHTEEGLHAYRYLKERGLSDETIRHFGLGFSSKRPGELYHYLKSKGYTDAELRESGLVTIEERGARDKFWNRVMFPIMDSNSRVIAFGGRVMGDGEPKYLNSPETKLFDKSKNLYGLNYARRKREAYIILCEGYMDVIALHQAGFASAVASLGTALTEQQILHLKRTLPNANVTILSYDSDNAGIKAARRAIPMIRNAMLQPRVLSMKPYKDPDEFIKALGREAYEERIREARNAVLWEVQILATQHDLRDPAEKTRFYEEIAALLASFSEPLERNNYIDAVAREQMIPADALRQLVNRVGASGMAAGGEVGPRPGPGTQRNVRKDRENASLKSQKLLLAFLAEEPSLYSQLSAWISPSDFTDDLYRELAEKVFKMLQNGKSDIGALLNDYVEDSEKESLVTSVFHTAPGETLSVAEKDQAILDCIRSIRKDAADRKLRNSSTAEELQAAMREKAELQHLKLTIRR